jgi:dinuclear metal center YbgI/SA1388 family protein
MPRAPVPVSNVLRSFEKQFETKIAPLRLAEAWDNVGMLVECPSSVELNSLRILACIDVTNEVVSEAIDKRCNIILSYHPVLFKAIHSLSLSNQLPLLRCIQAGINIFVPHTALDSASGGMNDYLCNIFEKNEKSRIGIRDDPVSGASVGRILSFAHAVPFAEILILLKRSLNLERIRYASPATSSTQVISSIAVCVGSGASVLNGVEADLYLTGEMSHHEILAATAKGRAVVLLDHSSSERPFLPELARRVAMFDGVESISVSVCDVEPIKTA